MSIHLFLIKQTLIIESQLQRMAERSEKERKWWQAESNTGISPHIWCAIFTFWNHCVYRSKYDKPNLMLVLSSNRGVNTGLVTITVKSR